MNFVHKVVKADIIIGSACNAHSLSPTYAYLLRHLMVPGRCIVPAYTDILNTVLFYFSFPGPWTMQKSSCFESECGCRPLTAWPPLRAFSFVVPFRKRF
jgi:hypothetical protein